MASPPNPGGGQGPFVVLTRLVSAPSENNNGEASRNNLNVSRDSLPALEELRQETPPLWLSTHLQNAVLRVLELAGFHPPLEDEANNYSDIIIQNNLGDLQNLQNMLPRADPPFIP